MRQKIPSHGSTGLLMSTLVVKVSMLQAEPPEGIFPIVTFWSGTVNTLWREEIAWHWGEFGAPGE